MRKAKINTLHRKYAKPAYEYAYRLPADSDDVVRLLGDGMMNDSIVAVKSLQKVVPFVEYFPSSDKTITQMLGQSSEGLALLARWFATFRIENGVHEWADLFIVIS
jgi:hypothetical protein